MVVHPHFGYLYPQGEPWTTDKGVEYRQYVTTENVIVVNLPTSEVRPV